ncbi:MAG: replication associated protein [Cressdnaviricota sp.]|nr:MAG: replication associated protein [Cressdnaviricota sp.]
MVHQFDGQLATFDVTLKVDETYPDHHQVISALTSIAKKWVFQQEQGDETGYLHWQIRLSLHKKCRFSALKADIIPHLPGHWSPTSNEVHNSGQQFNYVMKVQTRLAGPWTDKDSIKDPPVLTTQLKNFLQKDPYPWQVSAISLVKGYDERHIHYIYDPHYNSGKSIFCEWIEYQGLGEEIPGIFTLAEDIMQFAMSMERSPCYLFDMPAAMKKEKMHQLYAGLEMLKNGFLYDKRYFGKKRRINRPQLICFANNLPIAGLIAPDRWQVHYITPDKCLVDYDMTIHPYQDPNPQYPSQFTD